MKKHTLLKYALIAALCALPAAAPAAFRLDVRPGRGVTEHRMLSEYNPNLLGTDYDTDIYIMKGAKDGARAFMFSATHAREVGGMLSTTILLENATVEEGTLFVIPCVNSAGMSVPDVLGQVPHELTLETPNGPRTITYGDRRIPLRDGESDPEEFRHPLGYVHPDGQEWRNINRNYPGIADGTPAQMVCFGIMELIRREKIDTNLDVHESTAPEEVFDPRDGQVHPGGPLSNSLITHPKYADYATEMIFDLEDMGTFLKLELSTPDFRGISHYEIALGTDCVPFLSETPNPAQNDYSYQKDPLHDPVHPIEERVGKYMDIFRVWFAKCEELTGGRALKVTGLPTRQQVQETSVGAWLGAKAAQ